MATGILMKKCILILLFILTPCLQGMATKKPFVTLISQEGEALTVPVEIAENSPVLKDLMENSEEIAKPAPIPVLVKLKELKLLIKAMRIKDDNPKELVIKLIKELGLKDIKDKNGDLDLLPLYEAAEYLELEAVINAIAVTYVTEYGNFFKYLDEIKKKAYVIDEETGKIKKVKNSLFEHLLDRLSVAYFLYNDKPYYVEGLKIVEPTNDEWLAWGHKYKAGTRSAEIYQLSEKNEIDQAKSLLNKSGNTLWLDYHEERKISKNIGKLTSLKKLYLGNNKIKDWALPEELGDLTQLEVLDLHNNRLQTTHDWPAQNWLSKLINLKVLNLSNNELEELPKGMEKLTKLEKLNLSHNKLESESLRSWIGKLTNLKKLDLSNNNLFKFPAGKEKITEADVLALAIPEEMGNLTKLEKLDLSHNKLQDVSTWYWIGKLTHLKELILKENHLFHLSNTIGNLTHLEILDLRENVFISAEEKEKIKNLLPKTTKIRF